MAARNPKPEAMTIAEENECKQIPEVINSQALPNKR